MEYISCPKCGRLFQKGRGALSRLDNETEICSDCGTIEALEQWKEILERENKK